MPRRWFQLHLSTLLAVTFAAALLMYLNLAHYTVGEEHTGGGGRVVAREAHYGWPLHYTTAWQTFYTEVDSPFLEPDIVPDWRNAYINGAVGLALLGVLAVGLETAARRKRAKNNA